MYGNRYPNESIAGECWIRLRSMGTRGDERRNVFISVSCPDWVAISANVRNINTMPRDITMRPTPNIWQPQ